MAVLSPVYWQAITPAMREVLRFIGQCQFAERFNLAGGTALALRLGHRRSIDLDFFSATDPVARRTRQEIVGALLPLGLQVLEDADGNLQPELLIELPWEQVKQFFIDQARALGRTWFEGQEE